ncbi:MAG: asparaginase domain-containing protein, partial [Patescibacteria group bacterium]
MYSPLTTLFLLNPSLIWKEVLPMKTALMPENPVVYVYNCGGTFEKCYGDGAGVRNFSFPTTSQNTAVRDIINRLGLANVGEYYKPERAKDSLDMNDEDRAYVAWHIRRSDITRLVVVHGTDTMVETARAIHESLLDGQRNDMVVIMTGALQPAMAKNSDAEFNLGGA